MLFTEYGKALLTKHPSRGDIFALGASSVKAPRVGDSRKSTGLGSAAKFARIQWEKSCEISKVKVLRRETALYPNVPMYLALPIRERLHFSAILL